VCDLFLVSKIYLYDLYKVDCPSIWLLFIFVILKEKYH
jgi:hypothetical protein